MLHEGLESLVGVESFQRRKLIPSRTELTYPGFIEPAIVSRIERVPSGGRWIHQIKFNGYRVQVHLHNSEVPVFTPPPPMTAPSAVARSLATAFEINASFVIIDSEVVIPQAKRCD
ncbi:MAG TPA: hypothetical protein VFR21_06555 [Bradyrhizobium sp.]|jgi:bifunctional non-homologous end joining protein LigD|nr:hypothetical protein [Bradyrhizobium sp.]